jgi:Hemingway/CFA97
MYPHVGNNYKKVQLKEERYTEIERENRILLEKISRIMNQKQHFSNRKRSTGSNRKKYSGSVSSHKTRIKSRLSAASHDKNYYQSRKLKDISNFHVETQKPILSDFKTLNNRVFSVEIFECKDMVKIVAEDSEDSFILRLKWTEALNVMNGREDWRLILNNLYMEKDTLVLYQRSNELFNYRNNYT